MYHDETMSEQSKLKNPSRDTRSLRLSSTGWIIKSLGSWLDTQMEVELKPLGLSISHFAVMMTLLENDGLTQIEIGRQLTMPGSAITRYIDRLEQIGYVKRHDHETSRRSYRIHLTGEGRKIAPQLYSLVEDVNKQFLSSLSQADQNKFQTILLQLLTHISTENKK